MTDYSELREEFHAVSNFLLILGDEKRQAILIRLLEESSCEGLQVSDLIEATGLSRPAISHHLKLLKDANLVDYRSKGTRNFYYLKHETTELIHLRDFLDKVIDVMDKNY